MRIVRMIAIWPLLLLAWLPLLVTDLLLGANDFGPGADIPYCIAAAVGTALWVVPIMIVFTPITGISPLVAFGTTGIMYLAVGLISICKLDIGPIQWYAPR